MLTLFRHFEIEIGSLIPPPLAAGASRWATLVGVGHIKRATLQEQEQEQEGGGNAWGGEAGGLPVPAWLLFWVPCPTGTVAGADYGKEREPPEKGW